MFFSCFLKMFLVGLATVVRLCFTSDIVLLIDWLYCIDLFSCIAASLFNKLTYLLTSLLSYVYDIIRRMTAIININKYFQTKLSLSFFLRDAMLARYYSYGPVSVCRLSVCLSQVGVLSNWLYRSTSWSIYSALSQGGQWWKFVVKV